MVIEVESLSAAIRDTARREHPDGVYPDGYIGDLAARIGASRPLAYYALGKGTTVRKAKRKSRGGLIQEKVVSVTVGDLEAIHADALDHPWRPDKHVGWAHCRCAVADAIRSAYGNPQPDTMEYSAIYELAAPQ